MYKIFFKDRVVHLTNSIETDLTDDFGSILKYANQGELVQFIDNFERDDSKKSAFVYHHNVYELLQYFRACFKNLPAAGGLVWNKQRDGFLGMHRLGYFDLPKGKVQSNETFEEAALREVEEECNITGLTIENKLISTYHTYRIKDQHIFKETKWYEMVYDRDIAPSPQKEENIDSVFWMSPNDIETILSNTYPSILQVLGASKRMQLLIP